MKRNKLIKHLEKYGYKVKREGSKHTLFINLNTGEISTIPRHTDIKENLCKKICKDLEVPNVLKKG